MIISKHAGYEAGQPVIFLRQYSKYPINRATTDPPLWANPLTDLSRFFSNKRKRLYHGTDYKKPQNFPQKYKVSVTHMSALGGRSAFTAINASTWTKCGILLYVNQVWVVKGVTHLTKMLLTWKTRSTPHTFESEPATKQAALKDPNRTKEVVQAKKDKLVTVCIKSDLTQSP